MLSSEVNIASYFMGIDVGTGSARAGVFETNGNLKGLGETDISLYRGPNDFVEQSSTEIWKAVCNSSKEALKKADINPAQIVGVGFDATCSLVVAGIDGKPLPVGFSGDPHRDIIVWMDHRAIDQADRINSHAHPVLKYVGGNISPEMQTPKLLWLKENHPNTYDTAWQFFDLVDYLTWRATGCLERSTCTLTCKWTYLGHERRWDESYFSSIGLGDLIKNDFCRIGSIVADPGTRLGQGLTYQASNEMGLTEGTAVGVGLIDAHAGGIGTVGATGDSNIHKTIGYVFGTSSCTMTTTEKSVFVPGVWGPYYSAMVPNSWLIEGGQSAAGAAIDQLLKFHPARSSAVNLANESSKTLLDWLADSAVKKTATVSETVYLAKRLHIIPEFLGNRAPFANPNTRAVIVGLGMEDDIDNLIALYVAGICGIGYGLRQIIQVQSTAGAPVKMIAISGGAGRSPFIRQILADTSGIDVLATVSDEPVLLGSAILGAVASGAFPNLQQGMSSMTDVSKRYFSSRGDLQNFHNRRFDFFEKFQSLSRQVTENE